MMQCSHWLRRNRAVVNIRMLSGMPCVSELLSEESKARCMKALKTLRISGRPLSDENCKRAAVLIPLCLVKEELSLLYTLRTSELKRHRGQVSFPGGMEDPEDESLCDTALRETEEEIGIPRSCVQVWGQGNIYIGNDFSVLPVVGYLGKIEVDKLSPNPDEVKEIFTVPLCHFTDPANCRYTQFRLHGTSYSLPMYINADHRIWGITALLTHIFLKSLIPDHYKHKVDFIRPFKSSL